MNQDNDQSPNQGSRISIMMAWLLGVPIWVLFVLYLLRQNT